MKNRLTEKMPGRCLLILHSGFSVALVVLVFWLGSFITARAGSLSRLEALSLIETADDDWKVGRAGEVSRYQIRPTVWRQYSSSTTYQNAKTAALVAQQHLVFLQNYFQRRTGRQPSEFDLYVMWNAGAAYYAGRHFTPKRVAPSVRERAERFVNLRQLNVDLQANSRGAR